MSSLSRNIRIARMEAHLTQQDLALQIGFSPQLVSTFERGTLRPDLIQLQRIADACKRPLSFFTGEKISHVREQIQSIRKQLEEIEKTLEDVIEDVPE